MKIILTGTNHSKEEEEVEVTLEYAGITKTEDTWTFKLPMIEFTVSDLTTAMDFLRNEYSKL